MIRPHVPNRRSLSLLVAVPFIVAACSGATADAPAEDAATAAATTAPMTAAGATANSAPETAPSEAEDRETSTWLDIELTDVVTGETFTLASLRGQVVAIEPMAIWCTNCKVQQDNVKQVFGDIEAKGIRYISLGVDPNENPDSLKRYAERREYPWTFAAASTEFARAINDLFGPQILSPPSTPLIVIDANGEIVTHEFGFHGPEKLLSILDEATA